MMNSCFGICCKPTVLEETHEHGLEFKTDSRTAYTCHGCKERGFGPSYQCGQENCPGYQLHEECTNLGSASSTPRYSLFSENVQFTVHKQPPEHVASCVACGKDVQGFRYHYSPPKKNAVIELFLPSKALVLHPCCFKLQDKRINNEGVNLQLKEKAPSKCQICQREKISKKIMGWAYVSTCGKHCYHVKCVKELVDNELAQQIKRDTGTSLSAVKQKALKIGKEITNLLTIEVLRIIILAIFGDPISAIVNLVLSLIYKTVP